MDGDICRWILEFLLRNPTEDHFLKKLLAVIPVSDQDSRLKRTVLLRTIETDISDASVPERILETMEMIEELDKKEGISVSKSMKAAYRAVAVECTVKYLLVGNIDKKGKCLDAIKMIWRRRVTKLLNSGKSELVSPELREWMDSVEAALWDANVRKKLTSMNTRNDALTAVVKYLGEAWAILGPPFLQLSATLRDRDKKNLMQSGKSGNNLAIKARGKKVSFARDAVEYEGGNDRPELHIGSVNQAATGELVAKKVCNEGEMSTKNSPNVSHDLGLKNGLHLTKQNEVKITEANQTEVPGLIANADVRAVPSAGHSLRIDGAVMMHEHVSKDTENPKTNVLPRRQQIASSRQARGFKITDPEELKSGTSAPVFYELREMQEALRSSMLELKAVVKDPLPDALQASEAFVSGIINKNNLHENQSGKTVDTVNPPISITIEQNQAEDVANANLCSGFQNNAPRSNLMERNSTAHTLEWNDSGDGSQGEEVENTTRVHLPSSTKRAVSPLKKYEAAKLSRRRRFRRWSLLEEDTLRTAVQNCGVGNWKLILNCYRDIFEERTEVDLKDKWRNMTKY